MDAFLSSFLVFRRPANQGDGDIAAASDDARRQSSGDLSTSTTPSEISDGSDDHHPFSRASSVYVAHHQGDKDKLPSRKTLVDFAEGSNEMHYFTESQVSRGGRLVRLSRGM